MKNYYEILGVPENATTQEIISNGRRQAQKYSVDHVFAGKRLGIDYTDEDWKEANRIYADIIEAYQILKDERQRAKYDLRLQEYRKMRAEQQAQAQARARQTVNQGQGYYNQNSQQAYTRQRRAQGQHEQSKTQGRYEQRRTTGQHEQRRTTQSATGYSGKYTKTRTDSTMDRRQRRTREKGAIGKMIDSFKDVRKDEKEHPFFERHQTLNQNMRREFHKNVKSVPGEIVYQMANGTLHVTYEFIHQLRKLSYFNEDSVPKYVFRNRNLAAAALAVALMASMPGGGEDIQAFPTPDVTIEQTQEQTDQTTVEETMGIVYEEPVIQMTQFYEVEQGDSLSEISTRTGVKVYEIQDANNRYGTDKIYTGETLILNYNIDREDLHYYTITIPAKGLTCAELAKQYRTDEETIIRLNKEAVAYINSGYTVLTDTAVVPNFITQEQLEMMKEAAAEYNTGHNY